MSDASTSRVRIVVGVLLATTSAVLLTTSFPPYEQAWCAWFGLVPMVVAQHRVLPARWSALAPAIGVGGFIAGVFGGAFPAHAAWYMKALPLLVAVILFFTSRGERVSRERAGYASWPIAAATGWVAFELLRAFIPALATWGFVGYSQFRHPWLLQPVRYVGVYGLDLLIVLVNYAGAMAIVAALDRRAVFSTPTIVPVRVAARWCAVAVATFGAWCVVGVATRTREGSIVRVAVVQPGFRPRDVGGDAAARDRAMLDRLESQTREAAARGARVVVWPEVAISTDPSVAYATELSTLARETNAYVVVGYGLFTPEGHHNEAITVAPDGAFVGRYGKQHPVGFLGETSVGRGAFPTLDAPFGALATMICADIDFTDTARAFARRGAKVVAVPSSDWPEIATQHYTLAVFRALESGAAFAKSEYSRDSAIVDPYGDIVASAITPSGSEAILVADVSMRDGLPFAARFGDWVGWACVVSLVLRIGKRVWRARSAKVEGVVAGGAA